jgi:hypothetical protein
VIRSYTFALLYSLCIQTKLHIHTMRSVSFTTTNVQSLENNIVQYIEQDFKPTLAIVFSASSINHLAIANVFRKQDIDLLGCTSSGQIIDKELQSSVIVVLLLDIARTDYKIFFKQNEGKIYNTAHAIRTCADASYKNPAMIILSSGIMNDGDEILAGLKEGQSKEIPIFGGVASEEALDTTRDTMIYTVFDESNNGMGAIVFNNENIEVIGLATSGWQQLGIPHKVTKAVANTIHTIENEPALDYFMHFFGFDDDMLQRTTIANIAVQYPFQVVRNGNMVLRSPVTSNSITRTLTLAGRINEGDEFYFSVSPDMGVVEDTIQDFAWLSEKQPNADALLMFSCQGRYAALGPFLEDEIEGVYEHWKKPMIGFLSYGEIGSFKNGVCEFHNETCSLVLIKERKHA